MGYLIDIILIGLSAALINNFVLHYFVGICPFIGVSRRIGMAFGMGCAVTFVIVIAAFISWFFTYFLLMPGAPITAALAGLFVAPETAKAIDLTILCYFIYIFAIAASVQFVEMYLRKFFLSLYQSLGVYLPLITTNCAILFACLAIMGNIVGQEHPWDLGRALMLGFGGGVGFTIAIVIMAGIREELDLCDVPAPFKGAAIAMVIAGILALAFMGFTGVDNGLREALASDTKIATQTTTDSQNDASAAKIDDQAEDANESATIENTDDDMVEDASAGEDVVTNEDASTDLTYQTDADTDEDSTDMTEVNTDAAAETTVNEDLHELTNYETWLQLT